MTIQDVIDLLELPDDEVHKTDSFATCLLDSDNESDKLYSRLDNNGFEEDTNESIIDTDTMHSVFYDEDNTVMVTLHSDFIEEMYEVLIEYVDADMSDDIDIEIEEEN